MKIFKILNSIPAVFSMVLKTLLDNVVSVMILQGSRSSGKTTILMFIIMIYVLIFPKGDVVIFKTYKTEHFLKNGGKDRLLNTFKKWTWLFPKLSDFRYTNDKIGTIERTLKNGETQAIIFNGIKNKGLDKSKSTTPLTRYVSLVCIDEAEENSGVIDELGKERLKQEIRDIQITYSRRENEFKNLDKYPRTKFLYSFNPKTINGLFDDVVDEYLPDDVDELYDKGFQYVVMPWYENGNGMAILKNNIYMLLYDKEEFWPVETDINTAEYYRIHYPEIWLTDFLGIRKQSDNSLFRNYMKILDMDEGIPQQYIPMWVGVDQGILDVSAMSVRAQTYSKIINKTNIIPLWKFSFPIQELEIKGRKDLSINQKGEHIKSVAITFINEIVEGYLRDDEWVKFYEFTPLEIIGMVKDTWLLNEMKNYIESKYKHLSNLVSFIEIKETSTSYKLENEVKLMISSIKNGKQGMLKELTPIIYKAYSSITLDNWKDNHFSLLNIRDSDRYANFHFLTYE